MDVDNSEQQPSATDNTHIHDLPDECLIQILHRVHTFYHLPRSMRRVKVGHPLHCALVCKRWRAIADAAIHTIHLSAPSHYLRPTPAVAQAVVSRFTNLTALSLSDRVAEDALVLADGTPQLQHLTLDSLSPIRTMTQALAKWTSLTRLDLPRDLCRYMRNDTEEDVDAMFHAISKLPSLSHLRFDYFGAGLRSVCTHVAAMSSLTTLEISCSALPLPSFETAHLAHALRKLSLVNVEGGHLPSALGLFVKLEALSLDWSMDLTALPESISCLSHLTSLQVRNCYSLTALPSGLGMLTGLKELDIERCERLEALPESIGNLASLQSCTLRRLPSLRALPEGVSQWQALTKLTIKSCLSLERLPRGLGQLSALNLNKLSLQDWCSLDPLSQSFMELSCPEDFTSTGGGALAEPPETIEESSCLGFLYEE